MLTLDFLNVIVLPVLKSLWVELDDVKSWEMKFFKSFLVHSTGILSLCNPVDLAEIIIEAEVRRKMKDSGSLRRVLRLEAVLRQQHWQS